MSDTNHTSGFGQFMAELRRRHVVRFALGYAAAAFVILQLAEIVFPAFGIGEGGLRLLVVAAGLAFPPSMVLAWMYDLTTEGLQRTEQGAAMGPVLPRLAVGTLLVATVGVTGALGLYLARQGVFETPTVESDRRSVPVTLASYDPSVPIRSIAVLPLVDFSPGADQAYFTASMHEELITKLSMLDDIRVVSRTSSMRYAGTDLTMPEIGEELDVDVVVEGSIARTPERTRVTLRLVHAPSESEIETLQWDEEELEDMLAFQTDVAHAVVEAIDSDHAETSFTQVAGNVSPEAQDAYLQGRYEMERGTPEGFQMAFEHFEDALDEEPEFAQAMAGMAGARFVIGLDETTASEDELMQARQEARSALALDSTSVEAMEVLAFIERSMPRIFEEDPVIPAPESAPKKMVTVMALPGMVDSLVIDVSAFDTAWVSAQTSLGERIEEEVRRRSMSGERDASARGAFEARRFMGEGRYSEAARVLESVVSDAPQFGPGWEMLARTHIASGEPHDAAEVVLSWHDSGAEGAPSAEEAQALYDRVTADGIDGYWSWALERWDAHEAEGQPVSRMELATAHAAMGHDDEALLYLSQALERGEPTVLGIRSDPVWDELRRDPRFREIGRQVQLMRSSPTRRGPRGRGPGQDGDGPRQDAHGSR